MQLIKNLTNLKNQVLQLYQEAFNETLDETKNIIDMVDLSQAYAYIDKDHTLMSMVCPVERTIFDANNEPSKIINLTCLSTAKAYEGHQYGLLLMRTVADKLVDTYDSVVWQTENWNLYKDFLMVDCTTKIACEYILGMYPTPMLIIWDQPNVDIIMEIEKTCNDDCVGVQQTPIQIQAMINMYAAEGMKYLANPCAYLWYDPNTKAIVHLQYSSLAHLTWLMHHLQPTNTFYLFDQKDLHEPRCLKVGDQTKVVTKTYKSSKKHFKNIKLNDYLI